MLKSTIIQRAKSRFPHETVMKLPSLSDGVYLWCYVYVVFILLTIVKQTYKNHLCSVIEI